MPASRDGDNYGKMVAFRFPKGTFIDGPAQVESRINSDSRFSGDLTLWDQHGSQVIRGNLIVLPLNGTQLIAIEPVYIEAEQTKIPTLARIVLAQLLPDDRKIEWAQESRRRRGSAGRSSQPDRTLRRQMSRLTAGSIARASCFRTCSINMPPATMPDTASSCSSLKGF